MRSSSARSVRGDAWERRISPSWCPRGAAPALPIPRAWASWWLGESALPYGEIASKGCVASASACGLSSSPRGWISSLSRATALPGWGWPMCGRSGVRSSFALNSAPRRLSPWRAGWMRIILPAAGRDRMFARILILLVKLYQRTLSLWLRAGCRFEPSCSRYAVVCLESHGAWRGGLLSIGRLCKCHPFHPGGYDPPPDPTHRAAHAGARVTARGSG